MHEKVSVLTSNTVLRIYSTTSIQSMHSTPRMFWCMHNEHWRPHYNNSSHVRAEKSHNVHYTLPSSSIIAQESQVECHIDTKPTFSVCVCGYEMRGYAKWGLVRHMMNHTPYPPPEEGSHAITRTSTRCSGMLLLQLECTNCNVYITLLPQTSLSTTLRISQT